jgi:CHAT domain-containing protein
MDGRCGLRTARGLAFLLLAIAACGCFDATTVASNPAVERMALIRAIGPSRPLLGRLAGFPYAVHYTKPVTWTRTLRQAAQAIQSRAQRQGSTEALANAALLPGLEGRWSEVARKLEQVIERDPRNARWWSDLAAARLESGTTTGNPEDLGLALQAAARAVILSPDLPEARFNLALALDRLSLLKSARSAWDEYQQIDPGSLWLAEARTRRAALNQPSEPTLWKLRKPVLESAALRGDRTAVQQLVAASPQRAREWAEEELLREWALSIPTKPRAARASLTVAREIGQALAHTTGDHLCADAIETIDHSKEQEIAHLALGHRLYQEGLGHLKKGEYRLGASVFEKAREELAAQGGPFAAWAEVQASTCQIQSGTYEPAIISLSRILNAPEHQHHLSLRARAAWLLGFAYGVRADWGRSLLALNSARALYQQTHEGRNLAGIEALLADEFRLLGDSLQAWNHRLLALRELRNLDEPLHRQRILEEAGLANLAAGRPEAALYFQQEIISAIDRATDPAAAATAFLRRATTFRQLGRAPEMLQDLAQAERYVRNVPDEGMRSGIQGEIVALRAEALRKQNPAGAIRLMTEALNSFRQTSYQQALAGLYAERGRARLVQGDSEGARHDFDLAVRAFLSQRATIADEGLRVTYLDQAKRAFEEAIWLAAKQGEVRRSFDLAEQARSRSLLETSYGTQESLRAQEVAASLPRGTVLIEFAVTGDRLLAWTFQQGRDIHLTILDAQEDRARTEIANLHRAGESDDVPAFQRASAWLYEALIRPLSGDLAEAQTLVLVPDDVLALVPFSALYDPRTRRYLVEERLVGTVPSASLYLKAAERLRALGKIPPTTALAVGASTPQRELLSSLPSLPHAEEEAKEVAALYPRSVLLTGSRATRAAVLAGINSSQVFHFAGHAVLNPEVPSSSFLVVAPDHATGDPGLLYVRDLEGRRLRSARLVFLAACSTANGTITKSEGAVSLARFFLAMGVPLVIGSLWSVNDDDTQRLAVELHHQLRNGKSALASLREAQLASLRDLQSTRRLGWAAFEGIGAGKLP